MAWRSVSVVVIAAAGSSESVLCAKSEGMEWRAMATEARMRTRHAAWVITVCTMGREMPAFLTPASVLAVRMKTSYARKR
jgi:hypothetical protein